MGSTSEEALQGGARQPPAANDRDRLSDGQCAAVGVGEEETGRLLPATTLAAATTAAAKPLDAAAAARRQWRLVEALCCVASVAGIWVGAAALTQYLIVDLHLHAPTLLTAVNSAEFPLVLLPLAFARERLGAAAAAAKAGPASYSLRCARALGTPASDWRRAARAGLLVCPLWVCAQGFYNASLLGTSVSSATVLSATSCVFTYLFARIWLRTRGSCLTAGGVLLTVAGAALVGWGDEDASARVAAAAAAAATAAAAVAASAAGSLQPTWWGDALALASAAAYALYSMAIKTLVPPPLPSISRAAKALDELDVDVAVAAPMVGPAAVSAAQQGAPAVGGVKAAVGATAALQQQQPAALQQPVPLVSIASDSAMDDGNDSDSDSVTSCVGVMPVVGLRSETLPCHTPHVSISVFFGFLGLFTTLALTPVVGLLHATGLEDLRAVAVHPAPGILVALALGKGLLDNVLSDLLWARAIQLADPTLAAAGLSLTIPLALASDALLHGTAPSVLSGAGAAVVAAGFVLCALGAAGEEEEASSLQTV